MGSLGFWLLVWGEGKKLLNSMLAGRESACGTFAIFLLVPRSPAPSCLPVLMGMGTPGSLIAAGKSACIAQTRRSNVSQHA